MKLFIMNSLPMFMGDKLTEIAFIKENPLSNKGSKLMLWQKTALPTALKKGPQSDIKVDIGMEVERQLALESQKPLYDILTNEPDIARVDFPMPFAVSIVKGVKKIECPHNKETVKDFRHIDIDINHKLSCKFCHAKMTSGGTINDDGSPTSAFHGINGTARILVIDRESTKVFNEREKRLSKYFVDVPNCWPAGQDKFYCLYLKKGEPTMIALRDRAESFSYDDDGNVALPYMINAYVGIITYEHGTVTLTDVEGEVK